VDLGPANGGMMLNVSAEGFSFRAMSPVRPNEKIHFAFAIDGKRRLEGTGELEWTEENGKVGGLQFTDVSEEFRREIRRWLSKPQPSVGAGRGFIPAAAAPVNTLEKPRLDLQAEPPRGPAAPLLQKPELKIEAPPAAAAPADSAEKQRWREDVQPRKPRTLAPPIEEPQPPKMLQPVATKVEEPEPRMAYPAVLNIGKLESKKETALSAGRHAMDSPRAEVVVVPDQVKMKTLEGSAVSGALPIVAEQPEEPAVERKRPKELTTAKEVQEGSFQRLSRTAAAGIAAAGMAVVLAGAVFSFRREVGESLIRLGEKMVGETKPADPERRATLKTLPVTPAMNPSAKLPSGSPADARANPVPMEAPPIQKLPSTPAGSPKVAAPGTALEEPGQAELAVAQRILGIKNGSRDITGAMKLLWAAVQKGNSAAVLTLSDLYLRGQVVAKNCAQARVLLTAATKKGSAEAKARLEQLRAEGCP
jgi:PilZ domain-containing protein